MTSPVNLAALSGAGAPITLRADQNTDGSFALRASIEVAGAAVGAGNAVPVIQAPSALTNSASGTVTTAAAIVVPFSATRKWLMISNRTTGTEVHDIGSSNVLVGGGIPVAPGGGFVFDGPGAAGPIYGVTTVANSPFSYVEA